MAGTYWNSTQQRFWMFTKQDLANRRRDTEDDNRALIQQLPLPDRRLISVFISQQITKLGKPLNARQQTLATAQVYIRRFYTRVEIRQTNPYLVLATAFYLASKMEECPQHIRVIVAEANHQWQDISKFEITSLGECEFALISALNSQLIVHHPYRILAELQNSFAMTEEEQMRARSIINDHYLTDLPLLHSPHVIALTAVLLAVVMRSTSGVVQGLQAVQANVTVQNSNRPVLQSRVQEVIDWLADCGVDMEAMADCSQEMISLYEVWEHYNEKTCKEQIHRVLKAKGLEH